MTRHVWRSTSGRGAGGCAGDAEDVQALRPGTVAEHVRREAVEEAPADVRRLRREAVGAERADSDEAAPTAPVSNTQLTQPTKA